MKPTTQKVLFVDDEINVLHSLKRTMKPFLEWSFTFVTSVDEAIKSVAESLPDIIVSDMKMPEKDGLFLIRHFKGNTVTANIPIVILTGSNENNLKKLALEAGAIDLVNKPITTPDLSTRIRNVLKLKEYQDSLEKQKERLEKEVHSRTLQLRYLHKDLIWRLAKVGELKDNVKGEHVERVARYCRILGSACSLSQKEVETMTLACTLHDLGKVGIADTILLKQGILTPNEMDEMRKHVTIGADILKSRTEVFDLLDIDGDSDSFRKMAATIVLTHHEKWDGTGYPYGLKGAAIPLEGRIAAVADVYDALRSVRPYKQAYSAEKSYGIIVESAGTHFDPDLVQLFIDNRKEFEQIADNSVTQNRVLVH